MTIATVTVQATASLQIPLASFRLWRRQAVDKAQHIGQTALIQQHIGHAHHLRTVHITFVAATNTLLIMLQLAF